MPGIRIGIGSRPRIFNNEIREMKMGIEVVSADPLIVRNKIFRCIEGLVTKTFQEYVCTAKVKLNDITRCNEVGIRITGKNNQSIILQNIKISKNKKSGIKVLEQAKPRIIQNRISGNME